MISNRRHGGKTADWLKNLLSWSMHERFPLTICGCKPVSKMSENFANGSIEQGLMWTFGHLELLLVVENAD